MACLHSHPFEPCECSFVSLLFVFRFNSSRGGTQRCATVCTAHAGVGAYTACVYTCSRVEGHTHPPQQTPVAAAHTATHTHTHAAHTHTQRTRSAYGAHTRTPQTRACVCADRACVCCVCARRTRPTVSCAPPAAAAAEAGYDTSVHPVLPQPPRRCGCGCGCSCAPSGDAARRPCVAVCLQV